MAQFRVLLRSNVFWRRSTLAVGLTLFLISILGVLLSKDGVPESSLWSGAAHLLVSGSVCSTWAYRAYMSEGLVRWRAAVISAGSGVAMLATLVFVFVPAIFL